jgi:hypothetical protein
MITRILTAIKQMEDTWFADALGIVFLAAIIPAVLLLGEVLQ